MYQDAFIMRVDSNGLMNDCFPVWVEPDLEKAEILVYPNPASNLLNVSCRSGERKTGFNFEIVDMTGKAMFIGWVSDGLHQFDISFLSKGIYLYRIITPGRNEKNGKFVKQ